MSQAPSVNQQIAIVLPDLTGGGAERVCLVLAHEFARKGHTVEFVLMRAKGVLLDEAKLHFSVVDLGSPRARKVPASLAKYLRSQRPDAMLVAIWPLTVLAPLAALLSGHKCKTVVSEHAMLSAQYQSWGRIHRILLNATTAVGYRLADSRVGVSHGVVADIARLSGLSVEAFEVIHNPVSTRVEPQIEQLSAANMLWSAPPGARVLAVGSFKPAKNFPLLLRAFAKFSRHRDASLMFLGAGSGENALRELATDLGIADRVVFAGFHHNPTSFYETADLFVLSSDHEGFGNVIVEALACGTPVVATDCPAGPSEILDAGRFGTLVPVGDAEALAVAMGEALGIDHDHGLLRKRALDFRPEVAARRYLGLLGCL